MEDISLNNQSKKMALSKNELIQYLKEGKIVSRPEGKINPTSIDVSLNSLFYRQKISCDPIVPYQDSGKDSVWEEEPGQLVDFEGIPSIELQPGEIILATTEQFIGARNEYTTMLKAKSTLMRLGLDVCASAGWGEPGYINRWAFSLHNRNNRSVILRPGTWIAQIVFFKVSSPPEESYSVNGSYQETDDIDKLIENWNPKSILPTHLRTN